MKERIEKILDSYHLSPSKFADELGIQRSGISHVLSGRNKPSLEFVQKVLVRFPEINSDWLVQGIGNMKKELSDPNQISMFHQELFQEEREPVKTFNHSNGATVIPIPGQPIEEIPPLENVSSSKSFVNTTTPPSSNKKIERVVIFYSDKTFAEYLHE